MAVVDKNDLVNGLREMARSANLPRGYNMIVENAADTLALDIGESQEISRSNICESDPRVFATCGAIEDLFHPVFKDKQDKAKLLLKAILMAGFMPNEIEDAIKWWRNEEQN